MLLKHRQNVLPESIRAADSDLTVSFLLGKIERLWIYSPTGITVPVNKVAL